MALCGISDGLDVSCQSLKRTSGIKKVWLFNLDDLTSPINPVDGNYVTGLEFASYRGLYLFDSKRYSHQATDELSVGDGGNVSWTHTVILRLFNDTPAEDLVLENLAVAEVGAIVWTTNNEFKIYGYGNGLTATAATETTGRNLGEDTTSQITLTGQELGKAKRLLRTDVNTTIAYLEALTL